MRQLVPTDAWRSSLSVWGLFRAPEPWELFSASSFRGDRTFANGFMLAAASPSSD